MKSILIKIVTFLIIFLSFSNSYADDIKIVSSINPIHQIVKYISGGNSYLLVDPSFSSHDYALKPSDIREVSRADVIFYVSGKLETYLPKVMRGNVDGHKVQLAAASGIRINTGDNHIWLNPDNAIEIAKIVMEKLSYLNEVNAYKYEDNFRRFKKEVLMNDLEVRGLVGDLKGKSYVLYHNGYRYYEDYYGLRSVYVISRYHGQRLSIMDMREIKHIIKTKNVKCLFGQKSEEEDLAAKIAKDNNIKFSIIDIIGSKEYESPNGYVELVNNFTKEFVDCLTSN